jgi:hypothetical protein
MRATFNPILRKCFILFILLFLSNNLIAQVRIKERVEINPRSSRVKNSINSEGSLPPTSYITYFSGTYLAYLSLDAKYQAPPENLISVTIRDTTLTYCPADYINYRTVETNHYINICDTSGEFELLPFTAYFARSDNPKLLFKIPNICKGDTLNFSYEGCTDPVWSGDVGFGRWDPDPCFGSCEGCGLTALLSCGIDLIPMRFTVWQDENTLIFGSSITLNIYSNGDLRYYYPEIDDSLMTFEVDSAQYAKFIYDKGTSIDTLDSPMDSVKYSDAIAGKIKFLALGEKPDEPVPVAICARMMSDPTRIFEDTIIVKGAEILLGETKYYYATEASGQLTIHETTLPQLPSGAVGTDIWGANPVSVVIADTGKSGRKMGVYWEKEKRIPTDTTHNLPTGMIRLIGRYWHKDSIYTVKLTTGNYTPQTGLGIEVKKPSRLGNSQYAIDRRFSRDVFDHPIDIDSICIFYGGLYGIPPQLIKGQMEKESRYIANFGFSPAYRYEPYTAQFWDEVRNRRNNPFFITNSICTPEPPNHQHVRDINYFTEVQSVWNVIINHSQLMNDIPDDPHRLYGIRTYSDTMNFEPYERPMNIYHAFLSHYQDELGLELQEAADSARNRMIVFLRDEWDYHVPRNNKGLINVTAQTRIASSYGLLQPMYTKALLFGYQENNNNLPELLNVTDTMMVVAMRYQKEKLRRFVGASGEDNNNSWTDGYENGFFRGVYPRWNRILSYPTEVFRNSRNYQPQKE